MAEIHMNVAANLPQLNNATASLKKETSSVSKPVAKQVKPATEEEKAQPAKKELLKERVQEDNIERDIVAVSTDGDTVAVSKDSEDTSEELAQQIASFAGISDQRVQQMYRDGLISMNTYNKVMDSRKAHRQEIMEKENDALQMAAGIASAKRHAAQEDIMVEGLEEDGSKTFSPKTRSDILTKLEERNASSARRDEENQRLWDYQLLA